jgi:hypothetical protein
MVKKVVMVGVLGLCLGVAGLFAMPKGFGIGIAGGGGINAYGASLALKVPALPVYWMINADLYGGAFGLGVTGDYYLLNGTFVPTLDYYVGVGGFVNLGLGNTLAVAGGLRVPIGISWNPIPILDLFLEVAPRLGVEIVPDFKFPYASWVYGAAGIRFWL